MSETHDSSCLVEQARLTRLQAKRCRAILKDINEAGAATLLREYAMQLEEERKCWKLLGGRPQKACRSSYESVLNNRPLVRDGSLFPGAEQWYLSLPFGHDSAQRASFGTRKATV